MTLWVIIAALAAILVLHLYWRRRLARAREEFRSGLEQQTAQTERQTAQVQSQQEAVLNSMVEGLLLLDEQGRIQLANRAFATLFEVGADIRGKTVLEALRLHELSTLVQRLPREGQVPVPFSVDRCGGCGPPHH